MKLKVFICVLLCCFLFLAIPKPCPAQFSWLYPRIEESDSSPSGVMTKLIFPADTLTQSSTEWTIALDTDNLTDVDSIAMLDEDETVTGAWAFQYKSTSAKTDNYSVTTSDLGVAFIMNASVEKTFTLPSVGASEDGAIAGPFTNIGAGRMIIDASDSDYVHDSGAGDTIYTDDGDDRPYPSISLRYIHSVTTWIVTSTSPGSNWTTTD